MLLTLLLILCFNFSSHYSLSLSPPPHIFLQALQPTSFPIRDKGEVETKAELQRFNDWASYSSWLLTHINRCKEVLLPAAASCTAVMAAPLSAPKRKKGGMLVETI